MADPDDLLKSTCPVCKQLKKMIQLDRDTGLYSDSRLLFYALFECRKCKISWTTQIPFGDK